MIWRIRDRAIFARFRRDGRRYRAGLLWMTVIADPTAVPPRVAYAVGRSVGKAAHRNRIRRRLRALTRAHAMELAPGWYLVGADPRFAEASFAEAEIQFATVVRAVAHAADVSIELPSGDTRPMNGRS